MHPLLAPPFERRVGEAVASIERGTSAEVVVVVVRRSAAHTEFPLTAGLIALATALTAVMFAEAELGDYLVYVAPLASFLAVFLLVRLVRPLLRLLLGARRRHRVTEILGRATFQKAGLHRTRDATAVLVFLSLLEGDCALIRDHGVVLAAGEDEWSALEARFARALAARKPDDAVLEVLGELGKVLTERLPPRPDDTDELPSRVAVSF